MTLRSDLVERLEALASHEGKTLNEVIEQFLNRYTLIRGNLCRRSQRDGRGSYRVVG
ncbi:MAG: hypothetical protein IPK19_10735 [Chloroflexi bacterium]|nr:hypothetical protein [Chloroflexota bacterium]